MEMTGRDQASWCVWIGFIAAISLVSSVTLIRFMENHKDAPDNDPAVESWLLHWVIITAAALVVVALIGGLLVFTASTRWEIVLTWPFVAGPVVGVVAYLTFAVMGQFNPGSASCEVGDESCNIALGLGAGLLSAVMAIAVGICFLLTYLLRRGITMLRKRTNAPKQMRFRGAGWHE